MNARPFVLRTIDGAVLVGPDGPVSFQDPRALALLAQLVFSEADGVAENLLLLRLYPDLTPLQARGALRQLRESVQARLGAVVERRDDRWAIAPGAIGVDVALLDVASAGTLGSRFLRGLSIPDAPELDQWITETGSRARAPAKRFGARTAVALVVVLVVALAAWQLWQQRRHVAGLEPGSLVVLADVDNTTGDSLFDAGLNLAASVSLQQSSHLGIVPRSRVRAALARAGRSSRDTALGLELAREVAAREGIRFVIAPRISPGAPGYLVSAILFDASTDRLVQEVTTEAEGRAGVLPALDRVLGELRAILGESLRDPTTRHVPLPAVTTQSLEALRSYALGAEAWRREDYLLAEELWRRALDQDTGFAMAMGSLGAALAYRHARDSARLLYTKALSRTSRLTDLERLRLEDSWASSLGDLDSSIVLSRVIAERYPRADTWFNYGTSLMQADRCEEAEPVFRRALGSDPRYYALHVNLATCARRAQRWRDALGHYAQAAATYAEGLSRANLVTEFGSTLVAAGLVDSAVRHFERAIGQTGLFERALGHRGLAFIALQRGDPAEAVSHFDAGLEIARQQRSATSQVRSDLLAGLARLRSGDSAGAAANFDEIVAVLRDQTLPPAMTAMAGWGLLQAGREHDAENALRRLDAASDARSDADQSAHALLTAELARYRGDAAAADTLLAKAGRFPQRELVLLLRADALEALGRVDSALALRRTVSDAALFGLEAAFARFGARQAETGRRTSKRGGVR